MRLSQVPCMWRWSIYRAMATMKTTKTTTGRKRIPPEVGDGVQRAEEDMNEGQEGITSGGAQHVAERGPGGLGVLNLLTDHQAGDLPA